jgi:hypothetical protein
MPKQYIINQANDILFWSSFYRKLVKCLLILCIIMGIILARMFIYNIYLKKNDFFLITTFGQVIEISPVK